MGKLEGKVAFVTGAARGQGRSHAVRMAQEGADIIAVDVCKPIEGVPYDGATVEDLEETQRAVEELDRRIVSAQVDVRDLDGLTSVVDDAVAELGRLDILSGNAGILGSMAAAEDLTGAGWCTTIDINLTGVYNAARAAIPHIKAGGRGGSIVLTSSTAGLKPYLNAADYVAAKHGVTGLTKALALELAPHSIRVNSLHPTQVDTPMIHHSVLYGLFCPDIANPTRTDFEAASRATNAMPVPWVEASDVSNALLFLVSDDARFITGAALPVDAGCNLL
ncbi:mycofactocin-coupled SDR family oxidoreductase [Geodermatophilus sabuli]|uniref:(+)-trans-carveol dehydrogenase/(-)-trans-carveol dehydrogenase n=1 Tax=Geodermatophilus sabuli TaxID=1564158 RepID=A0A285E8U8_9ACTN|nr:mycofactocin-coupled SDR family oxidoreductase [Geodermatophilus sabuli]MBB3082496.1 SDR family mycofactocin-dependent oxidoreductase [Geodermatophilus sabuli]SNX94634.1 (+)-trans-carveol dehydrogenase/(-)-trans-carveol dehydrogenase [Geodermatophilus sabuli]